MAISLSQPDYDAVRKLIDIQLTESQLSNDVLSLDAFAGEAIRWVAQRTSNEDDDARTAVIYRLAMQVLPAVPRYVSESNAGYSYTLQQKKSDERITQLSQLADEAIARSEAINPTQVGTDFGTLTTISQFDVAERGLRDRLWWEDLHA